MAVNEWVPAVITIDPIEAMIASQLDGYIPAPLQQPRTIPVITLDATTSEPEPEPDSWKYPEVEFFIDQNAIKDSRCIISLDLAKRPVVHAPYNGCRAILCNDCYRKFVIDTPNKLCPLGCSHTFNPRRLPHFPPGPTVNQMKKQELVCNICTQRMQLRRYAKHMETYHL
jgi:hypothetical protein